MTAPRPRSTPPPPPESRRWHRLFPNPRYYGWVVVGVGLLCTALSSPGQSFIFSLYLDAFISDLGLSRLELSSTYGAATLAAAACLPLLGRWADRTTARTFLVSILCALGVTQLAFSCASSLTHLAVGFFFLRLLGQGALGLGTLTFTVRWFRRYRGRALGLVSLGYAVGELLFPGLIIWLLAALGWRGSLGVVGVSYLLVFAPLVGRLLRERDPLREALDGAVPPGSEAGSGHPLHVAERSYTLGQALRERRFWGLLASSAVSPLLLTAVVFHQVALFESQGWERAMVPVAFMAFALASVMLTYVSGLVLERVPTRFGASAALLLALAALMTLLLQLPAPVGPFLYGALLGMAAGTMSGSNAQLWPDYFGVQGLGAIKGVVTAARNGAAALGPPLLALLQDGAGSFGRGVAVLGGLAVAGGLLAALQPPPQGSGGDAARDAT
ncbi:MFS transporter [Myxococcus sp. SDU36]|uniref:MFS transporter n=1 Tax=Myxococcus sp. SDU36 TaxID=2831967 RepID=UPI002543457E|nr:MFS transporter [Myxococcus sp. SDU36]WIG97911.1 MFS transporter [Myxococcus sp. SDU36]